VAYLWHGCCSKNLSHRTAKIILSKGSSYSCYQCSGFVQKLVIVVIDFQSCQFDDSNKPLFKILPIRILGIHSISPLIEIEIVVYPLFVFLEESMMDHFLIAVGEKILNLA
jgi:hypothetical protein